MVDFERYIAEQKILTAKEEKMKTIKELMDSNIPIEIIAKSTRISVDKVDELLKEIKKLEKEGYF